MSLKSYILFFTLLVAFPMIKVEGQSPEQERKKIQYKADILENGSRGEETFRKLKGNVVLKQKNTNIYCDSAYFFNDKNAAEAFGNVRVEEGDTITITGKRLMYNGATKQAIMHQNVVYKEPRMTLYTDSLQYMIPANMAYYYKGGKLVDSTNVLTSETGNYNTNSRLAAFKKNVVLTNPDYKLESDTLQYNYGTKMAYTKGPTKIITNEGDVLTAEVGSEFNTKNDQSLFRVGEIETEEYLIQGNKLLFQDKANEYSADGNVTLVSKKRNVTITGDHAIYKKDSGIAKVFGHTTMKKLLKKDTFFLSADTLVSIEDTIPENERLLAYKNVELFKSDLQGIADSLAYHMADSVIHFFQDPVLWTGNNQIEGDSIRMEIQDGVFRKMITKANSFVISKDTLNNFNQLKGRKMTAYFDQGKIQNIFVDGNAESIYFPLEGDTLVVGMNKTVCSTMRIDFKKNQVEKIHTFKNPEASMIPPHEIEPSMTRFKGFNWRIKARPTREKVIKIPEAITVSYFSPPLNPDKPSLFLPNKKD